ncbi:hypothetical protein TTHERM_00189380 (macronuclear) [Tetrahymena thermophila SB210]|uniref:Uncharacterized protein n=1 Tax=Tetrahymena thermophila (strain SB210) TaxID=312017 RepID=I7LUZ7_TETTS|nr:hypothetical protein TTHERM_00189380 [Tetrahymena thermophila SB210]EAR96369.2 hypothetical protein TTHERM_00189380 [Tetrahymena thermophila SB210]|eukprot:XP_001016614.2 hypothetical protein TTHERM_00189380 [Tetrahymena thermophila SB210]
MQGSSLVEPIKEKIENAIRNMRSPFRHYPRCVKCPLSKDMSLVCLNHDCGENYFKLICPYCHRNEHQRHELKVEDDLDLVLQMIEDHTRQRYMNKQVTDQDIGFVDLLLESQKALNKLLNKIQQVKFILDDTLNGYKRRMKEYEDMIRLINNAQMSSSQAIINEQLQQIKDKIVYNSNETDVYIEWNFEKIYNETEKKRREGYSQQCLKTINQCEKSFKNLLQNFRDVVNPILEKRLIQKVCLDKCNQMLELLNVSWRWEKYEDIVINYILK